MEPVEAVEEVIEELFPPKPGGLVDKHRKRKAAEEAAAEEAKNADERIEQASYRAVKVAPESPEGFSPQTITIAAGAVSGLPVLPNSPYRYRATILVITAGGNVLLAKDQGLALGQVGFTLPAGVPLPVFSRGQLWGYNPGGAAVQVSVIAELYAPEAS